MAKKIKKVKKAAKKTIKKAVKKIAKKSVKKVGKISSRIIGRSSSCVCVNSVCKCKTCGYQYINGKCECVCR